MSLFNNTLKDSETLFKNEIALDSSFTPKKIQFRENESDYISTCIKPLLQKRPGKNLLIYGPQGIGKTLVCKKILEELEEITNDIYPIYINCWKKPTTYQLVLEICKQINIKFTQNLKTDQLIEIITQKLNRKSSVFIFDEIDKASEPNLLYNLLEDIYRKTLILITNETSYLYNLDPRLKSRLMLDLLEFRSYNYEEILAILKSRLDLAFYPGVFENKHLEIIAEKTLQLKDIRIGLFLLKESALSAESKSSKKISFENIQQSLEKLKNFQKPIELDQEERKILEIIKENPEKTTSELLTLYQEKGGKSERTFQRKLQNLKTSNLISLEKLNIRGKSFKVKLIETNN